MRLEIEPTLAAPPLTDHTSEKDQGNVDSVEAKSALNHGIKAAQAGDRSQARASLLRATEIDPRSENGWLWLASISEYPEELLGFLNHVLEINPSNQRAIEWKTATHGLLSKTFVQRGIDASQEGRNDIAAECFQTALEYDDRNAAGWMWMASLSDSSTVKITLLEKAIALDPENEAAVGALAAAKSGILKERLTEAKSAAVSGNNAEAIKILDSLLEVNPDSIDAWTMRSHLAEGFDEKIRCFESILAIDPSNVAAKSGRDSLLSIFGTADGAAFVETSEEVEFAAAENKYVAEEFAKNDEEASYDKSPTQDLEMPADFSYHPADLEAQPEEVPPVENHPEENNEEETMEFGEEPFDSFAEEAPDSLEVDEQPAELAHEPQPAEFANDYQPVEFAPEDALIECVHEGQPVEFVQEDQAVEFAHTAEPEDEGFAYGEEPEDEERLYADPQAETVAFSYDVASEPTAADEPAVEDEPEPRDFPSDPEIPMPSGEFPAVVDAPAVDAHATVVEAASSDDGSSDEVEAGAPVEVVLEARLESADCPFCRHANDPQSISCQSCHAVLTLSDLELLLANQGANKLMLRQSVEEMERARLGREFNSAELVLLGIGHLNLRNLQLGYSCLADASRLDPNNVVLSGQVNALLIRLDEIKQQEEAHLRMPKGKSILVVDDSATVRKLIAGKLEKCGHDVICANDGVEAMERLDDFIPDLILLDITMPRMDGYQVCKTIRSNNATKDVPVVMISGKDGFFDKVRGRMAGTTGYITKPFGPETLMKAVEMYLSGEFPETEEV